MVRSLGLFSALASGTKPKVMPERLKFHWLRSRLEDMIRHQERLAPAGMRLRFCLQEDTVSAINDVVVYCDVNLLEHAVHNLLDNAQKYSDPRTTVQVVCGTMDHARLFFIAVQNTGLRIEGASVKKMIERGWRSDEAWLYVGEGQGIGLYLVNEIMDVHRGRLQISPTTSAGSTTFGYYFQQEPPLSATANRTFRGFRTLHRGTSSPDRAGACPRGVRNRYGEDGSRVPPATAEWTANPPAAFVIDVMLRYMDRGDDDSHVPEQVRKQAREDKFYRAGIRNATAVLETPALREVPLILHSILDEADLRNDSKYPVPLSGNVMVCRKEANGHGIIEALAGVAAPSSPAGRG